MIPSRTPSKDQRVSRISSLCMFRTVLNPISGSSRPHAMTAVTAASRQARMKSRRGAASGAISDFLHVGPAEQTLRQEDHGNCQDGEGGNVLVVDGEVSRPQGLD